MALDQTANFVRINVSGTHTDTDTTIQLETGEASNLPDPVNGEYNLVWWNDTQAERPSADPNVEIVRVTARDTGADTITVQRGQENTVAVAHDSTGDDYRMILSATSKMFSDINDVTNLDGSAGTSGQFLSTDGTNLSFATPEGGMTVQERQVFNDLMAAVARNQIEHNLAELAYDGGFFTIYRDQSKISSVNQSEVLTLDGGDANGIARLIEEITGTFDISTATFSQSISTQDGNPSGLVWNSEGTKLYEIGYNPDSIYEYDVSTAFDISTATFSQSISAQDNVPQGLAWNNDGTKLYEIGDSSDSIYEYNVSTAFDISTATFSQSISTQDSGPQGLAWNNDGTKLYEIGKGSDSIYEYDVSTAFDISTATFSQSISTQDSGPQGLAWNNDGTKLYEIGYSSDSIYEYDVSTAFDISTATFSQSISTQDSGPQGLAWNNDGTKLYEIGKGSDSIYEYDVSSNQGFYTSGTVTFNSKDLSADGFSNPPSNVVVSQSVSLPSDTDIEYTVSDGTKSVTVTQSDVDTVVDVSSLTSTTVDIEATLFASSDRNDTPVSDDVLFHFKE